MNIAIRGYRKRKLCWEERYQVDENDDCLTDIGERHARWCMEAPSVVEIEFLDIEDPNERFLRIGSDTAGMVRPVKISG